MSSLFFVFYNIFWNSSNGIYSISVSWGTAIGSSLGSTVFSTVLDGCATVPEVSDFSKPEYFGSFLISFWMRPVFASSNPYPIGVSLCLYQPFLVYDNEYIQLKHKALKFPTLVFCYIDISYIPHESPSLKEYSHEKDSDFYLLKLL